MKNKYKNFLQNLDWNRSLGRANDTVWDNIKVDFKLKGSEISECIKLDLDRVDWPKIFARRQENPW
jgi:hypothetical protein